MPVSVIGLGRLGAPLAAILADCGHRVIGVDCDPEVVAGLQRNAAALEPGLHELLLRAAPNLTLTTSTAEAVRASDATFLLVPTPSLAEGDYSNAYLLGALTEIGAAIAAKPGLHLVVVVSTVMPGTMDQIIRPALEQAAGRHLGPHLGLCYCPEFVALGAVIAGMRAPDIVLIGQSDAAAGEQLLAILRPTWTRTPAIRQLNFINAEVAKLAINGFVTTKISYANMLAEICDNLPGADVAAVTSVLGSDSRIGSAYLAPGLGFAGPCFPRDNAAIAALARRVGTVADLAEATDAINRRQAERVVATIRNHVGSGTIGILGLAYKPGSDVCDGSQGLEIAAALAGLGYRVLVHDPAARPDLPSGVTYAPDAATCVKASSAVVIATPWPEYGAIDWRALARPERKRVIVDCWRMLEVLAIDDVVERLYPGAMPG